MSSVAETADVIEAADTAIRVAGVLKLAEAGRPCPSAADEALKRGIEFIDQALAGTSLLTGSPCEASFAGSLSPLCWATDGYLIQQEQTRAQPNYKEVEQFLASVRDQLEGLREHTDEIGPGGTDSPNLEQPASFFRCLARVLTQRADVAMSKPSGPCVLSRV